MHRLAVLVLGLFLVLSGAGSVRAITALPRDFDQLVSRAETVFKGTVSAKTSQWMGEGTTRHIVTFVTFQVEETYKGQAVAEQKLRFLGGAVGDDTMEVPDMPQFSVGQKAVLFVVGNGKQFCPLVGVAQGRFHVRRDDATGRDRIFTENGSPVVSTAAIGQAENAGAARQARDAHPAAQALTADEFKAEIVGKVAALQSSSR